MPRAAPPRAWAGMAPRAGCPGPTRSPRSTSWRRRARWLRSPRVDGISARAARAAERSERGVRTRRASPAGARGGAPRLNREHALGVPVEEQLLGLGVELQRLQLLEA